MRQEPNSAAENQVHFSSFAEGITLMRANFTDHAFERHSHDCYAIGVTGHGVQNFRCKGRQYSSREGQLVVFNPDEDHDGDRGTSDGFGYTIWYLPQAFVQSCMDRDAGQTGSPYFASPHLQDRRMASAFAKLSGLLPSSGKEPLRNETMLRAFVGALLSRYGERPQPAYLAPRQVGMAQLLRVKGYMRERFRQELTVTELAAVAGLSRAHLTRAFSAAFHTPPHVYLNTLRIAHAQRLIRAGMPLAMVAAECGFADQSHFTRRFKGSVGLSPSEWRMQTTGRAVGDI